MAQQRVFILDDEADNLAFLGAIIEDAGYAVESEQEGAAALDRMDAAPPDLVFLDVQMPGMNGFQVLKAMRSREPLADVPVVLLSAIGAVTGEEYDPDTIEERYGVRPDAFMPKPIEPDRVDEMLHHFLKPGHPAL